MVPETVAFSFVAGVNPLVGLYASFVAGLATALVGGRPGMITGGAGSLAVVSTALVAAHGIQYLFAAVILMGVIQVGVGAAKLGKVFDIVPHPVMLGFLNGLAIVIFLAQMRQVPWSSPTLGPTLAVIAITVVAVLLLPRATKQVPAALVAIGIATVLVQVLHLPVARVGGEAHVAGVFPTPNLPQIPWSAASLQIVLPYAFLLAGVGLTESLLTQQMVDEVTDTKSSRDREAIGQGVGNILTGFFGGMGGCAMIGQTVINLESGGRQRFSAVIEALSILGFILFASSIIEAVPLAALIGVMLVVVYRTFAWTSLARIHRIPRSDAAVMLIVTGITVWKDLATGVIAGVIVASLIHAWEHGLRTTTVRKMADGEVVYVVTGSLFFGSVRAFASEFQPDHDGESIVVDFQHAHLVGTSAAESIDALIRRYRGLGKEVHLRGIDPQGLHLLASYGVQIAGTTS